MRNVKNLALFVLMLALVSTAAVADIHYVNPGESIQAAIVAADPGDEIEVAPGTYYEAIDFKGKAVRLYSSGGQDVTTIDGTGHYHVVQCINSEGPDTILEGFTITGGDATGSWPDDLGGGMFNNGSNPTVTNCIFSGNTANHGGGMYNKLSDPTVTNCTFNGNTASDDGGGMFNIESSPTVTNCSFSSNTATDSGGGMLNYYNANPTVNNCTFSSNTADRYGGGMYNMESSPMVINCTFSGNTVNYGGGMWNFLSNPTVINCTFSGNTTNLSGGGMYNEFFSRPTVTNCTFTDNTASDDGGGMYNWWNSSSAVTNCTFTGNTASDDGGGMHNDENSSPTVTKCTFTDNIAQNGGGMYNEDNASPTVTNCTFTGNTTQNGGGMYNEDSSSPTVTNCTFTGNTAYDSGGGMYNWDDASPTVTNCTFNGNIAIIGGGMYNRLNSSPTVTNCILWADSPNEIFDEADSSTTATYSDVQGGTGESWFGEGCIDTDPMFADADGRLLAFSPCLDAGNDAAVPPGVTTDLDGNPRIQGVCVDMGAFESDLNYMDSGWIFMPPDAPDFGYSLNEADLLYFYSWDFVQSFNLTTGGGIVHMPTGWVYIDWPFYYESDTDTLMFALPPEIGLLVYHFSTGQWEVLPQIIP